MAAFNLDVGANTRRAERDIQKLVNKSYNINLKTKGDQPLGRITGQVNEFTKSLDASNARVIAFGASAGIIYGVQRAFEAMARSVIDTQKSLQDINVILNVSSSQLQKFGANLFGIARDTGQSFDAVAKAATEFSRQGLGIEETLKRTSNALILSRLSGLDAAKSVEALTAAVNSFANQAVTTTEIVNKFANVDAAFAVSSADLADAISRVGSSAAQSGVSLNELIAIVTSAQQTTARGGAVIGNSFKTIFTRLQRTQVIDLLENLGISTTDSAGQIKSTISLLTDLAKVYDQLGTLQQSAVAEKVGGVFQINILKAALADLGKEYSVYNNALQVAASSTDQAIQRNQELNKTYAAQLNALQENAKQLGANAGGRLLGPAFDRIVGGANKILGGINESDGQDAGAVLAKGILDGLGQVIAGPGLALIGGIFLKLFKDLTKFATGSLKDLLGLNTASKQQADLQKSISQILAKQPQLLDLALKGEQGLSAAANSLLTNLQKQTVELQKQAQVAAQISKVFYGAGVRVSGGVPTTPTKTGKAAGHIPNFASDKQVEKAQAMALGATPSVRAHMSQGTIGGKKFVMNNQETEYPGVGRNGDSMVIPHYAARGFIPNKVLLRSVYDGDSLNVDFTPASEPVQISSRLIGIDAAELWDKPKGDLAKAELEKYIKNKYPNGDVTKMFKDAGLNEKEKYGRPFFRADDFVQTLIKKGLGSQYSAKKGEQRFSQKKLKGKAAGFIPNFAKQAIDLGDTRTSAALNGKVLSLIYPEISDGYSMSPAIASYLGQQYKGLIPVAGINKQALNSELPDLNKNLGDLLVREANQFGSAIGGKNFLKSPDELPNYGAAKGAVGVAFEGGLLTLLKQNIQQNSAQNAGIDFRQNRITPKLRNLFHSAPGMYDAKYSSNLTNDVFLKLLQEAKVGEVKQAKSGSNFKGSQSLRAQALKNLQGQNLRRGPQLEKAIKEEMARLGRAQGAATGFIPNFAALGDAISRERSAGVPNGKIYIAKDKRLAASGYNPLGLGVFNTRDEPTGASRSRAIKNRGFANGYIPNFAEGDSPANLGSTIAAVITQLGIFAYSIRDYGAYADQAQKDFIEATSNQIKADKDRISQVQKGTPEYEKLNKSINKSQNALDKFSRLEASGKKSFGAIGVAIANSIGLAAPIIGQTIKNAIGSETKGARVAGAGIQGATNVASYASIAAQIAKTGSKGKAAGITALITGALELSNVFKELNTDLPELSNAARLASEKLTAFGNLSQTIQTKFEQIQDLAGKGQAQEAGKMQTSLVAETVSQIQDAGTRTKVLSAITNKDTEALRKALEENNKILTEANQIAAQKEAVEIGVQDLQNLQPGLMSGLDMAFKSSKNLRKDREKRQQKEIEIGKNIFNPAFGKAGIDEKGNIKSAQEQEKMFKGFMSRAAQGGEQYAKVLEELGFSEEQVKKLVDDEFQTKKVFLSLLQEQINQQTDIINNTSAGNPIILAITKSLKNIQTNYSKYSKAVAEGTKNLIASNAEIQNALGRIQANASQNASDLSQSFFGENAVFAQDYQKKSAGAGLNKIKSDYETPVRTAIAESLSSVVDIVKISADKRFGEAATVGSKDEGMSAQQVAEKNFNELPNVIAQISKDFELPNLEKLLEIPTNLEDFKGFNVEKITTELAKKFPQTSDEELGKVVDKLSEANRTLQEQKRIQTEQKILLAQNKLSEIEKAFVGAIQQSFGGFEGFLSGNLELLNKFDESAANLKILKQPGKSEASQVEFGRNMGSLISELSKIAGRPIAPELGGGENNPIIGQIVKAQATEIEQNLNSIFSDLQNFQGSQEISDAFRATLSKQLGLGLKATNQEIAQGTAKEQTKAQMAVGQVGESVLAGAREQFRTSSPELFEALKDVKGAFLDPQTAALIELKSSNNYLQEIALNTKYGGKPEDEKKREEAIKQARLNAQKAQEQSKVVPSASRGYLPRFAVGSIGSPIMANDSEWFVKNAKREIQDARRINGKTVNPVLINGFNFNKDAILNEKQYAQIGHNFPNAKKIGRGASGFFPIKATETALEVLGQSSHTSHGAHNVLSGGENIYQALDNTRSGATGAVNAYELGHKINSTKIGQDILTKTTELASKALFPESLVSTTGLLGKTGAVLKTAAGKAALPLDALDVAVGTGKFATNPSKEASRIFDELDINRQTDPFTWDRVKQVGGRVWTGISNQAQMLGTLGYMGYEAINKMDKKNLAKIGGKAARGYFPNFAGGSLPKLPGNARDLFIQSKMSEVNKLVAKVAASKTAETGSKAVKSISTVSGLAGKGSELSNTLTKMPWWKPGAENTKFTQSLLQKTSNVLGKGAGVLGKIPGAGLLGKGVSLLGKIPGAGLLGKGSSFLGKANPYITLAYIYGENFQNFQDPERIAEFNEELKSMPWYSRAVAGFFNPTTSISGASLAIQEALGGDPTGRLAKSKMGQGTVMVNGQKMTIDEYQAFQKQQSTATAPKFFPGAGPRKGTAKDIDDLQKQMGIGKYAPKSKTPELKAPVPISDNGIVKRYKTAADAELASRLAKQKNKQVAPFTSATTPTQTAKFPDQIIKKETTPSQDDLRKSMPPEYFRRIAKRNVMELEDGYNQLIKKTKDPAKAMALRKKLTEIQSLYNQKIDSRDVDMDAFNQIEEIYKSTKKVQTNFEDYHKTPEYRNQVRMRNFAKGSLPMASQLAIAKEGMGGVAPFDMKAVQRPEVQGINNINGMALMERNEINKERLALGARGVIPHFAGSLKPNKTSNEFKFGDMNFNTDGSLTQEDAKKLQESIMQHVQDYMSNNSQSKQKSSNDEFLQALRKDSKFSQYNPPPRPKK